MRWFTYSLVVLLIAAAISSYGLIVNADKPPRIAPPSDAERHDVPKLGEEMPPASSTDERLRQPPRTSASGAFPPPGQVDGNNLPPIQLYGEWRFRPGDNPEWSTAELDDGKWERVDLNDPHRFEYWEGTGWFRYSLNIDDKYGTRAYVLRLISTGAAMVYLDGEIVASKKADESNRIISAASIKHPASSFHLRAGEHTIAVRIERDQIHGKYNLLDRTRFIPFRLELIPYKTAVARLESLQVFLGFHLLAFGLTLAIGVYHLIIWRLTRIHTRLDLFFGAFSLMVALRVLMPMIEINLLGSVPGELVGFISQLVELAMILGLVHLYMEYVKVREAGSLYLIIGIWVIEESLNFLVGIDLTLAFYLAAMVVLTRLTILAVERKSSGWPTLYSVTALMLVLIVLTDIMHTQLGRTAIHVNLMITMMMMIPYFLIAIRMARLHAFNLISLHNQLQDNEKLRLEAVERERLLHQREIQQLQLSAEFEHERLEAVQQTAAGIAHELNTPLAVAGLGADMILMYSKNDDPDTGVVRNAGRIAESVEKMGEIIKKLLKISQVETKLYVDGVSVLDLQRSSTEVGGSGAAVVDLEPDSELSETASQMDEHDTQSGAGTSEAGKQALYRTEADSTPSS